MNTMAIAFLGFLFVIVLVTLLVVGLRNRTESDPLADRLAEYGGEAELSANLEDIEMSVPFSQRVLLPLAQTVARFTTQFTPQETLEKTQKQLRLAGNPNGLTPSIIWFMRFGMAIFMGAGILTVLAVSKQKSLYIVVGTLIAILIGFMLPQMWLGSKIKRRQDEVIKSLPDALDLMSICVNAGLGLDQAMGKVYDKWENELGLAFGRVIQEIQVGKTRKEALRDMDESFGVADVTTFVGAIIQADQLGVSMTKILNIQADQMRIKRRQRAEQKAQQAPVAMMIPLAIFIFPSIYIVLLGPAVIQVFRVFVGGG